jgi:hypothetical protein
VIRWLRSLLIAREIRGYQPLASTQLTPPPMPPTKPARDYTDWDVAEAAVQSESAREPGRIEYRFLGITGMEDE